jgi:CheY-like chemotaxis protein
VISDLKMPNMGGIELLERIAKNTPDVVTVIMTGFGTVETAIDAMKRGAYDYVLKPFKVEEVVHTIQRERSRSAGSTAENLRLQRGALALQGERGDLGVALARRGARHRQRRGDPRCARGRVQRPARRPRDRLVRAHPRRERDLSSTRVDARGSQRCSSSIGVEFW